MGLSGLFHRGAKHAVVHLVGRITETPTFLDHEGPYMVFRLDETPDLEFHLKMLPTTLKRHRGDRVEITYARRDDGTAVVETLSAAFDPTAARRRNAEYLQTLDDPQAARKV